MTVLSWLRINCRLVDFHRPTSPDGRHPELFNWVLKYFEEPRDYTPPLYLQHQGNYYFYFRLIKQDIHIRFVFNL